MMSSKKWWKDPKQRKIVRLSTKIKRGDRWASTGELLSKSYFGTPRKTSGWDKVYRRKNNKKFNPQILVDQYKFFIGVILNSCGIPHTYRK